MNNKYLEELDGWMRTNARTFNEKDTREEFVEYMEYEDEAMQMSLWV